MPSKFSREFLRARATALLLFLFLPAAVRTLAQGVVRPDAVPAHRSDRILIIPKAHRAGAVARLHAQAGSRVLKSFPRTANIQVLEVPKGVTAEELVARYRQSGEVESAGLDHLVYPAESPNDPGFTSGDQWYLNNSGFGGGVADADIDAPEAWDSLRYASNIIVAVIDSGVRQSHEDLAANLWTNPGEIPGNGFDDDGNGTIDDMHGLNAVTNSGDPEDDFGHGTHVSGILGAVGNNGLGVCGVAWKVQIMTCKFLYPTNHSATGSISDLVDCLNYAMVHGAKVINCSIEAPSSTPTLSAAFSSVRDAGIIVVAAAGNSGRNNDAIPTYPASLPFDNIVSVMATTSTDDRWSSSNYGATSVDLGAPGASILSTYNGSDTHYSYLSGTSMATPCVAGAVALLLARFPSFDHHQIISRLLSTVDPLPSLAGRCVTGGRLNLARALGTGDFARQPATFSWVATNGMTRLTLANDGVSVAQTLPFAFNYYGQNYSQIYVGANGIIGFVNSGLATGANVSLPATNAPNAIVCPYWDDLNPALAGNIWIGFTGTAPNRKAIVSWVDVPHFITAGGQTRFTFQAILHESRQIAFQYLQVQSGNSTLTSGRSATIGVEDATGTLATEFAANTGTAVVANSQAILFTPVGNVVAPSLVRSSGPQAGQVQLSIFGQPAQTCVIYASQNLAVWTALTTNTLPASGILSFSDNTAGSFAQRFYRAGLGQ